MLRLVLRLVVSIALIIGLPMSSAFTSRVLLSRLLPAKAMLSPPRLSHPTSVPSLIRLFSTTTSSSKNDEPAHGYDTSTSSSSSIASYPPLSAAEISIQKAFAASQLAAPPPSFAESVRTLISNTHGFAVLSTQSTLAPGYPQGSVVGFAPLDDGRLTFFFSRLASHWKDIQEDSKVCVTVAEKGFKGAQDGRVALIGDIELFAGGGGDDELLRSIKANYLKYHPKAFWINFSDFECYVLSDISQLRFVGGFAKAGNVEPQAYYASSPDPITQFSPQICSHLNDDHSDAVLKLIFKYCGGLDCDGAEVVGVDRFGLTCKVSRKPRAPSQSKEFKVRVNYVRGECKTREEVRARIEEMVRGGGDEVN
jgi:putative heme iron utilization protein